MEIETTTTIETVVTTNAEDILGAVESTGVVTTSNTETIEETAAAASNWENFQKTLPIMGKGMLGIFIVTAVIILTVTILNKVTNIKKKDDNDNE